MRTATGMISSRPIHMFTISIALAVSGIKGPGNASIQPHVALGAPHIND